MSTKQQAYAKAFMETLSGAPMNERLLEIFARILARQLTLDPVTGDITPKSAFATLSKVFTFVATQSQADRPATGPLAGYTPAQVEAAEQAAEQAADAWEPVDPPLDPGTYTLAGALEARAAGTLPAEYTIRDTAAILDAASTVAEIQVLSGAKAINVHPAASVAEMVALNAKGFTNLGTYSLADTLENLLANEAITGAAQSITVDGAISLEDYATLAAINPALTYHIEDTAENILAADPAVLGAAASIFATDVADIDQAFALDALGLNVGYAPYESTLEEAFNAEALPLNYTIDAAAVFAAGEVSVADAEAALATVQGIIAGAQNSDALVLATLFTWSVADTLANLEAADPAVLAGGYRLTNEDTDLGELTPAQYLLVREATNEGDYTYTVQPASIVSFSTADTQVTEGSPLEFTVELSHEVNTVRRIEYKIEGVAEGALTAADPGADFGFEFNHVDVPANTTEFKFSLTPLEDGITEGPQGFRVVLLDNNLQPLENGTSNTKIIRDPEGAGRNINLSTDADEVLPGAGNDTITGTIAGALAAGDMTQNEGTLSILDNINPGATSKDILRILDTSSVTTPGTDFANVNAIAGLQIENVNEFRIRSAESFKMDTTGFAGTEKVAVLQGRFIHLTVDNDTAVDVTGISGTTSTVQVKGGSTQTINVDNLATKIDLHDAEGNISVTSSKQTGDILIDGGADVTVVASSNKAASGHIKIGEGASAGAADSPTGAVKVTQNLTTDGTALDNSAKDINVTGGTSVDVTINASNIATKAAMNGTLAIGDVNVIGDGETTEVTVTQNADNQTFTSPTVAEVKETTTITFKAMTTGQTLTLTSTEALTFTAAKNLTAAEVAQAFSGLVSGDRQDAGGPVKNGIYSGQFSNAWSSGVANGDTVVFTANSNDETDITFGGTATAPSQAKVPGTAASGGVTTTNAITYGDVDIQDDTAEAITHVTLDGFAKADLGVSGDATDTKLDALTHLSIANNTADGNVTLATAAETLDLTVNNITSTGSVVNLDHNGNATADGSQTVKTLTINAVGEDSTFDLAARAVESLTINAAVALDIATNPNLYATTNLKTVDINGAGAVNLGDISTATGLDSFDASGNTGGVTASIETEAATLTGDIEEYVFSGGNDFVTLTDDTVNVDIKLGAGNDFLTLESYGDGTNANKGTATTLTGKLDGGTGTNTLRMSAADAVAASANTTFQGNIDNFQTLWLGQLGTNGTVKLQNMDNISHVMTQGTTAAGTLAVQTIDLAGLVLNSDGGGDDDITIGDYTYTAQGLAEGPAEVLADIDGKTVTISAVAYTASVAGTILTLTANAAATVGAPATITVGDNSTATATDPTAGTTMTLATPGVAAVVLTLESMANDGTVHLLDNGNVKVQVKDADTATDNELNVVTGAGNTVDLGILTVDDVETIKISTTGDNTATQTLTISADSAETITVGGTGNLKLSTTAAELELVDATAMTTGGLEYTATVADLVVRGGAGADELTANANDVHLYGGAGNDRLIVDGGLRVKLDGGAGNDIFQFTAGASSSLSGYAYIENLNTGDTIVMGTVGTTNAFRETKIALSPGADATLLNYANQAMSVLALDEMGWFQHNGNTFIVLDRGTNSAAFQEGTDMIVMLTGLVDLSTASYNSTVNTLEIA